MELVAALLLFAIVAGAFIFLGARYWVRPKAAIERGYAMRVADLQELPNILQAECATDGSRGDIAHGDTADVKRATSAGSN